MSLSRAAAPWPRWLQRRQRIRSRPCLSSARTRQHTEALLIGNDAYFNSQRERFVALAAQNRLPACYESREAVRAGGFISYSPSFIAMYRRLGSYAAKVLKGEKPADLPVEQPSKFELTINLKTAAALGLAVPPILLAQADEVIE